MRVQWALTPEGRLDYRIALGASALIVTAVLLSEFMRGVDLEGEALVVYTVLPIVGWLIGAICLFVPIRVLHILLNHIRRAARASRASS